MTRRCRGPVRAALKGKGQEKAFSGEEIDAVIDRLAAAKKRRTGADANLDDAAGWRAAAEEITAEELKMSLVERRMRLAQTRAQIRRTGTYERMGGREDRQLLAVTVGDEALGFGRGLSVDAQGRALQAELWGELDRAMKATGQLDRVAPWHGFFDSEFEGRVEIELARVNGGKDAPTGDAEAVKVAEAMAPVMERARTMQNAEGAWIAQMEGYNGRQTHDALKVAGGFWKGIADLKTLGATRSWDAAKNAAAAKAFKAWRDFTVPRLDARTFDGIEAAAGDVKLPFLGEATTPRDRFLAAVWWDIVTGRHAILKGADDLGDFRPPPSKARSVSQSRVLHYRDATARREYRLKFGASRSLYADVVGQLGRAAGNTALMRTFGPSPRAAFEADLQRGLSAARDRNDTTVGKALGSSALARRFDEIDGTANAPENLRLATVGRLIRVDQSLSKLGGMLLSAFSDAPIAVQTMGRVGVDFLEGYDAILKGVARLQGPEGREIADMLDVGARSAAAELSSRFAAGDGPIGWSAWAMRFFYKANGFEFWSDGVRRGAGQMLGVHFGREAVNDFASLRPGTREQLERFGIDEGGWDILRKGVETAEDGRPYLTFDALDKATDAELNAWAGMTGKAATPENAARAREDLGLRYRTLISDTLDTALSEARARENSALKLGTKPGTTLGEAVRLFTQFWAFPLSFMGRHVGPAAAGGAGKAPAFLLAHLILSTTIFGLVSMQAKQIVKGREMRPLFDDEGRPRFDTFLAAGLQGGGLGIYGDFLFGEYNRFGGSPIATLGGPAVGEAEKALKLFGHLRGALDPNLTGDERKESLGDAGADTLRFVTGNTPFVNLWWTRQALDMGLLWHMNEWLSPGWAARYEKRVEEETGAAFIVKPTEIVGR
ncbi:hypothetical protein [Brevundimonas sp.]|uniref:hypothetical protein n=1 Tax=Brevundimonas sp. TaxID=1871086 RepID=UPI0026368141|nr:hypothetical protein [Brevundimonas sp.]